MIARASEHSPFCNDSSGQYEELRKRRNSWGIFKRPKPMKGEGLRGHKTLLSQIVSIQSDAL